MKSSYRSILKVTSITGGTQVITIFTKVINSKILAVILGPAGTGAFGLLQSTLQIIITIFGAGLSFSAIRNVAEAKAKNNQYEISLIIKSLKSWLYITGICGTLFTLLFANWLSNLTFGNDNYTNTFRIISFVVLITQISNGQLAILQGYRLIKELSMAKIVGGLIGLFITIPLYYLYKEAAFPYVILLLAIATLWRSWHFSRKIELEDVPFSYSNFIFEGKSLFSLGLISLTTNFATELSGYLVRIFIQKNDSLTTVGIYQAAWTIAISYLQLIFTAMSADYYPRLIQIFHQDKKFNNTIEEQGNVALWLGTPLIVILIAFSKLIIPLLYSNEFLQAYDMIRWMMLGIYFKLILFPIGYFLPVLKKNYTFLCTQVTWQLLFLCFIYFGWPFFGLSVIGYSFALTYFIHLSYTYVIVKIYMPTIEINKEFMAQIMESFIIISGTIVVSYLEESIYKTIVLLSILLYSTFRSLLKLKQVIKR